MLQERLKLAGRFSILNVFVTVLHIVVSTLIVTSTQSPGWPYVFVLFGLLSVVLWIYILSAFMELLNSCFSFFEVDILLAMLIWNYVFLEAAGMARWLPGYAVQRTQLINLFWLLFGVLTIVVGVKLLKLKDGLYGLARPLSYGLVVTGAAYAAVIFLLRILPVAVCAGIFVDIILAAIFFRAAKEVTAISEN